MNTGSRNAIFPRSLPWLAAMASLPVLLTSPVLAGRQDCFSISDSDQRRLCLADYDGKGVCTLIDDRDLRNYCKAAHGDGKGTCVLIEDEGLRARCRAEVP